VFVLVWAGFTLGGLVSPTFLASPVTMAQEAWLLFTEYGFHKDIGMTVWRVLGGFVLAASWPCRWALPWAPTSRSRPSSSPSSRSPLPAGLGLHSAADPVGRHRRAQKLLVIFIGSFFQIVLMVAVTVGGAARPGGGRLHAGPRPRHRAPRADPGAAPEIAETLRLVLGWAWTYVIVAELIGSSSGIGHMITDSQALLATGQIIFGIIVIGLIGLVSDFASRPQPRLFVWSSSNEPAVHPGRLAHLRVQPRQRTQALLPVDFEVRDNDFVTILGPSGCGKSRCCASWPAWTTPAPAACCSTASRCGPGADRGMVFQSYTLFPWLTVEQNMLRPARARHERGRAEGAQRLLHRQAWACAASSITIPSSCRAACSSARRLRARWPTTPRSCCSTSPSARSTTRPAC
jgi:NitT/TauT family transport system permease protein